MKIFIDTSAWVALENKKDIHYKEAITFRDKIKNKRYRLYTSNFILDETYTLLLSFRIMEAVFEVHNILGPGYSENIYESALAKEFGERKINCNR